MMRKSGALRSWARCCVECWRIPAGTRSCRSRLSDELKQKIAQSPAITGCNGCQIDWARQAGADLAVWGTVQKVSNLILNINVYMDDTKDGHQYFGHSVDIRGNTDKSWQHGIRYLVRHYLFDKN